MKGAVPMAKSASADEKDWQAEADLRTLIEAEKIEADPARRRAAMKKLKELKKAVSAIGKERE